MNKESKDLGEPRYEALEDEATIEEQRGPRDFFYQRKISLGNYSPRHKFETEDFGVVHDSHAKARKVVEKAVDDRISELSGAKKYETKD